MPTDSGPAREILAHLEAIDGEALGHARHEVEHFYAALGRHPAGREPLPRQSRHVGLDHVERRRGRGRRIERIAALREQTRARLRGERMRRRDNTFDR